MNVLAVEVEAVRALPPGGARVAEAAPSAYSDPSASSDASAASDASDPSEPSAAADPYRYLTALRQSPPGVKSWG
jgi:hypothetical protein